jgi:glycosyltransferase involved in cell wall biosynthesis
MPETAHSPRFLLGTVAHNQHVGNIARAFYEADALGAFYTGGVDWFRSPGGRVLRKLASHVYPRLEGLMSRRRISGVPPELIFPNWRWEGSRLAARYLGLGDRAVDWVWEHGELSLDRNCARLLRDDRFDAYFGVEHGALSSIQAARAAGKKTVVGFLSPHHATYAEWVDIEYDRFPELLTPDVRKLQALAKARDARRDEEACTADIVHCASMVTARSLTRAGLVTPEKLTIVPLGCPSVKPVTHAIKNSGPMRLLYSGPVSVRKGAHILLDAWRRLRPRHSAELHIYGAITVPLNFLSAVDSSVVFHGPVSSAEMSQAYQEAAVLVFPSLCDGFGMVVNEAFAHGLPVITTPNAGATDLVREGQNGFIVPARDVDCLAERLEWCIDHPEDLEAMRPAARETALGWQWSDFRDSFRVQLAERLSATALVG